MSDTHTLSGPQPLQVILHRSAVPLLLFSAVLFALLLLSYALLLPQFTQLHRADGTAMSPRQIARYERQMTADLLIQEEERVRLVLPLTDSTYMELKRKKAAHTLVTQFAGTAYAGGVSHRGKF